MGRFDAGSEREDEQQAMLHVESIIYVLLAPYQIGPGCPLRLRVVINWAGSEGRNPKPHTALILKSAMGMRGEQDDPKGDLSSKCARI
jgi:hypothetical protein